METQKKFQQTVAVSHSSTVILNKSNIFGAVNQFASAKRKPQRNEIKEDE